MSHLHIVTGPPGYVCLTRAVGPDWASQENYVAQVTPEEARRIVAVVNEPDGRLTETQANALGALRGALDAPVVERQEEEYNFEDTVDIGDAAREVMAAFGIKLAELQEVMRERGYYIG